MSVVSEIANVHLKLYAQAALDLNAEVRVIDPHAAIACSKGAISWRIFGTCVPINDSVAFQISSAKIVANRLLRAGGVPVPHACGFTGVDPARRFFRSRRHTVVVKPNRGLGGSGVTLEPRGDDEFAEAFRAAKAVDEVVVIEPFVAGRHYRVLVLDGRVIAAAERVPPFVIGDGTRTIEELVAQINEIRREDDTRSPIRIDGEVQRCLSAQGLLPAAIPAGGVRIDVRRNANLTTGGITIDRTDDIHPDTAATAVRATEILGLRLGGVDLIAPSIHESIAGTTGVVNEVNGNPGLRIHQYPAEGTPRPVATLIQQSILASVS